MKKDIQLIGAGGLALDIISCFKDEVSITGLWDDYAKIGDKVSGIAVLGNVADIPKQTHAEFIIAVGNPLTRKMLFEKCSHLSFATLIHSSSTCFAKQGLSIGKGSILMPFSYLTGNVSIGDNVLIHIGAGLHHDVRIGSHSVVMPGAKITCSHQTEECFQLDTNATLSA